MNGDGVVDESDVAAMLDKEKNEQSGQKKAMEAHNEQAEKDNAAAAAARAKKRVARKK